MKIKVTYIAPCFYQPRTRTFHNVHKYLQWFRLNKGGVDIVDLNTIRKVVKPVSNPTPITKNGRQ